MKFHLDQTEGNRFTGYGEGYVEINSARHTGSLLVAAQSLAPWSATSLEALAPEDFSAVVALKPEVLLLGTGERFRFPEPAALASLYKAGVGVEVMDTPAACRTFNILVSEGRNVVAALLAG